MALKIVVQLLQCYIHVDCCHYFSFFSLLLINISLYKISEEEEEEGTKREEIVLIPAMIIVILIGRVIMMIARGQTHSHNHSHRVIIIMITVTASLVITCPLNPCQVAGTMEGTMVAVSSVVV